MNTAGHTWMPQIESSACHVTWPALFFSHLDPWKCSRSHHAAIPIPSPQRATSEGISELLPTSTAWAHRKNAANCAALWWQDAGRWTPLRNRNRLALGDWTWRKSGSPATSRLWAKISMVFWAAVAAPEECWPYGAHFIVVPGIWSSARLPVVPALRTANYALDKRNIKRIIHWTAQLFL